MSTVAEQDMAGNGDMPSAPYRRGGDLPWAVRLLQAREDLAARIPMDLSRRYADGDDYAALLIAAVESKRELAGFPLSEIGTRTVVRLSESVAARQALDLAAAADRCLFGPRRKRLMRSAWLAAEAAARLAAIRRCGSEG